MPPRLSQCRATLTASFCFLFLALALPPLNLQAQDRAIPMTKAYWTAEPDQVAFVERRSVQAARGLSGAARLSLDDVVFSDGTIEFDVELEPGGFVGIYFRESEDRAEREDFYIRAFWPVSPLSRRTLQYATVVDSMSLWDLTDDYQAAATLHREGWNHVKLVVSGRQLRAYVNDMERPALHVPILEGETRAGGITLRGAATFANFVLRPGVTEGVPATAGYDPTAHDTRYLRDWRVTAPMDFPFGRSPVIDLLGVPADDLGVDIPDSNATWTPIRAGHRALVNLSRAFGQTPAGQRRLVWVRTTLTSEVAQQRRLDLGFSDEVWVFVNGQFLHTDTNYYATPGMKEPYGRATLDNASVTLPLVEGENELLIGLSNYFFGWGLIARLDDTAQLTMK